MTADVIISVCIAVSLYFAIRSIIKHKSITNCSSCGGNCGMCGKCRK